MTEPSVCETPISGLGLFRREPYEDHRGSLDRLFDLDLVRSLVPGFSVAQVNHTVTVGRGTVRGLHYQVSPFSDAKASRFLTPMQVKSSRTVAIAGRLYEKREKKT